MIFLVCGVLLLVIVLRDIFHTVIVPRGESNSFRLAPILVHQISWPSYRFIASKIPSHILKAEMLGLYAPLVFMMLLALWVGMIICAFGLISFAFANQYSPPLDSLLSAFYVSGSSVLTLGSTEYVDKSFKVRFLMLVAAFTGMIVTASVVSLFFALVGAIQRREVLVSMTSNVAGSPPSGIAILETHFKLNGHKSLSSFYDNWHRWCGDVFETQKAYPILPYFRSNDPCTSWLTALGAVLDSASLLLSVDRDVDCYTAKVTYQFGCSLINELAKSWKLDTTRMPEVSDDEFHSLYLRLRAAGYCSHEEETAKQNFARLRHEYVAAHLALCEYIAVPLTPVATEHHLRLPLLTNSV